MSTTYKLQIAAPVAPDAVASAMLDAAAGAIDGHQGVKGSLRGGGWFEVEVTEHDPPDPVEARFGFAPTIDVYFGLSKSGDFESQETDMLRVVLGVLARISGDAVLHFEHDEVWLLRRDGRVTINGDLWKPQQQALLSQPYERASLAFD